jgi:hypothetical protein
VVSERERRKKERGVDDKCPFVCLSVEFRSLLFFYDFEYDIDARSNKGTRSSTIRFIFVVSLYRNTRARVAGCMYDVLKQSFIMIIMKMENFATNTACLRRSKLGPFRSFRSTYHT